MGVFSSSAVAEMQFLSDFDFPRGGETQKTGDFGFPQGGESRFFPFFDDSVHGIRSFRCFLMIPPTEFAVFSVF